MEGLEALKNEGNRKYGAGDISGAVAQYLQCLEALRNEKGREAEKKKLEVTVCTNLSLAYIGLGEWDNSTVYSQRAFRLDPSALKAHIRWVEARHKGGYSFDALVHSMLYVRPLLRKDVEEKKITVQESTKVLQELESDLMRRLGLRDLAEGVELVHYNGGVDMISRAHFKTNDVIFVEKKYITNFGETELTSIRDITTEMICAHFAKHLMVEQEKNSDLWNTFRQQFFGAWPRSLSEVDDEAKKIIGDHLHSEFPSLKGEAFDEIFLLSLMCRYNCFYSGFFRVCALANHNCQPNIAMKYNNTDETVTMTVVSDVKPGEMLNVKYLGDAHFLMGLGKRREFLRSWLFWCSCERCKRDNESSSIQEYIRCRECRQYTHMAVPGDTAQPDPLVSREVHCMHCKHSFSWDDEHKRPFGELLQRYMASGFPSTTLDLWKWTREQLKTVRSLEVHPANWLYRMVFYFICVPLTQFVSRCVEPLRRGTADDALRDMAELSVKNGFEADYLPLLTELPEDAPLSLRRDALLFSDECGNDALKCLMTLWHLIKDFYPAHEMWSIHSAINNLVLLLLLFPPTTVKLSSANALELLQRHGPYIELAEESKWLQLFNMYRGRVPGKDLPNINKVKSAFSRKKK